MLSSSGEVLLRHRKQAVVPYSTSFRGGFTRKIVALLSVQRNMLRAIASRVLFDLFDKSRYSMGKFVYYSSVFIPFSQNPLFAGENADLRRIRNAPQIKKGLSM